MPVSAAHAGQAARPLTVQEPEESEDEDIFGNDARFLSRLQAYLPVKAGGLGLGCAATTMEPAYIAGWVDFLHFTGTNDGVFPAVAPLVTPTALENSSLYGPYSIFALREAWTYMDVTGLARPSVDEPGEILPGALEMQEVHVLGVNSVWSY